MIRPTKNEMTLNLANGITLADGALVMKLTGPGGKAMEISIPLSAEQAYALGTRLEYYACHGTDVL